MRLFGLQVHSNNFTMSVQFQKIFILPPQKGGKFPRVGGERVL